MKRPLPPPHLQNGEGQATDAPIEPSTELASWLVETFIAEGGALANEDHEHLRDAVIGALWCATPQYRHGRRILAQTQLGRHGPPSTKLFKARLEQQTLAWFGVIPDFIITFDVEYALSASDVAWCALAEHELYHAAQAHDENGPRFNQQTGLAVYTIRGHDIEEFLGVVKRYGPWSEELKTMCEIAANRPVFTAGELRGVCGNCA